MFSLDEHSLIKLAEEDLYTFVALTWKYAGGKKEFIPNWYIEAICEHLEAMYNVEIKNLIISIAPRKGKSLICSVIYPVWVWLRDGGHRFITASYGAELSIRDAKRSKDLIECGWFREKWGNKIQLKADQRAKGKYETTEGGRRIATSVDGMATGEGADTLIIDDPHKAKEATSIAKLRNVIDWFTGTMSNRYEDIDTFRKLIIHQRVSNGDLTGYLMQEEPDEWEHLKLPEEYVPTTYISSIGWSDPRKYKGELLAPELLNEEAAEKYKKNKFFWASQYQQEPVPDEGGYVLASDLNKFSPVELMRSPMSSRVSRVYTSWDLAYGEDILRDYTVGQLWVVIEEKKFLIHHVRGKWSYGDQLRKFLELQDIARIWIIKSLGGVCHLIEKKASGEAFEDTLKKQFGIQGIVMINPRQDKINRFMEVTFEFEQRNVYYPEGEIGNEWLKEITSFPYGSNDDQVDATSQFLKYEMGMKSRTLFMPKVEEMVGVRDIVRGFKEEKEGYIIRPSGIKKMLNY